MHNLSLEEHLTDEVTSYPYSNATPALRIMGKEDQAVGGTCLDSGRRFSARITEDGYDAPRLIAADENGSVPHAMVVFHDGEYWFIDPSRRHTEPIPLSLVLKKNAPQTSKAFPDSQDHEIVSTMVVEPVSATRFSVRNTLAVGLSKNDTHLNVIQFNLNLDDDEIGKAVDDAPDDRYDSGPLCSAKTASTFVVLNDGRLVSFNADKRGRTSAYVMGDTRYIQGKAGENETFEELLQLANDRLGLSDNKLITGIELARDRLKQCNWEIQKIKAE